MEIDDVSIEEAEAVHSALETLKRRAVADVLDKLALSGWMLYHVELEKEISPSELARRIEKGLVASGNAGTVNSSPTHPIPEGGDPMTHLDSTQLPSTVSLQSKVCPRCQQTETFEVPTTDAAAYLEGTLHIQDALPTLTNDQRERLISGYCAPCWDAVMDPINDEIEGDDEGPLG